MEEHIKRSSRAKMVYVEELGALVQEDLLPDLLSQRAILPEADADPYTGAELHPGRPELCQGNGEHPDYEICCDNCDYFLACFPEYDKQ